MPWFMDRIKIGFFEVVNPYNRQTRTVPATTEQVHTIVFWSKNFHPLLKNNLGSKLQKAGYHLFFNFTINSESPLLEPHVPSLDSRLEQLVQLCDQFGPGAVSWRFDPICSFTTRHHKGVVRDNLDDLERIAEKASETGIKRCITSFMDAYPKIDKRLEALPGFSFSDPSLKVKRQIVLKMEKILAAGNIKLKLCCEKEAFKKDAAAKNRWISATTTSTPVTTTAYSATPTPLPDNPDIQSELSIAVINVIAICILLKEPIFAVNLTVLTGF